MDENSQTPSRFRRRESVSQKLLAIPPTPFLEKLGYGTGVNVWKLQPSPSSKNLCGSPWAIKNVRRNISENLTNKFQSLIKREANILKSLNHENIVGFRGYLKSEDGRNCLAMEVGGESLGNLIESRLENDSGPFPAHIILKVALSIAKALMYLHNEKKILHGDIKSYNIVIKNDFDEIKLCDFGFSLSLDDPKLRKNYVGTPIYGAPECQEGATGPITEKADIFSLGLVLWEMISLCPPHTEDLLLQDSFVSGDDLENSLAADIEENYGTRPCLPPVELGLEYAPVIGVFYACTEQDPEERPFATQLVDWLEEIIKSLIFSKSSTEMISRPESLKAGRTGSCHFPLDGGWPLEIGSHPCNPIQVCLPKQAVCFEHLHINFKDISTLNSSRLSHICPRVCKPVIGVNKNQSRLPPPS